MGKAKQPKIEIPEYKAPAASSFQTPWGKAYYQGNTFRFEENPTDAATTASAQNIRKSLIEALGLQAGGTPQEDPYANLLFQESKRQALPGLENVLIGRGLGGSSIYKEGVTDLLSKLGTQASLGSEGLKQSRLQALQNYLLPQAEMGQNTLNQMMQNYMQQQGLAQQMYNTQLPYLAKYNAGKSYGGLGSLIGMGAGALASLIPGMQVPAYSLMMGGGNLGKMIGGAF